MTTTELLLAHAAATWAMVGLIWLVQLVQYPGFGLLDRRERAAYHDFHCRRIAPLVGTLMGTELLTGLGLLALRPAGIAPSSLGLGAAALAALWLLTAFVSVPLHHRLPRGGPRVVRSLVATNWVRTAIWTARGALVLTWLAPGPDG